MNVCQFFIICKRTNNANNATHYVKLGKKRRESSKRDYYITSPRVIIKASIILNTLQRTTIHCNTLQHTAAHCNTLYHSMRPTHCVTGSYNPLPICDSNYLGPTPTHNQFEATDYYKWQGQMDLFVLLYLKIESRI